MDIRTAFEHLRKFDTPTICNALEIVRGKRFVNGFTRQRLLASFPALPSIVGYARTAPGTITSGRYLLARRRRRDRF